MANYPQLDDCSGVWTLKEVNDAVMGGYWREAGSRGIFSAGRYSPSDINIIDFVTISTTGNATDFGIHTTARRYLGGCASFTRGIFAGGYPATNVVDYITISSTGNAADFGDTTQSRGGLSGFSNSTRGIFAGGRSAPNNYNIIEYIAMSSTGNTIDFGDWGWQLNFYRYLLETNGYEVDEMFIQATVRDAGLQIARERGITGNIYMIEVPYIDNEHLLERYITKREALLSALANDELPEKCTDEETWNGMKCESYCSVREVCPYNQTKGE